MGDYCMQCEAGEEFHNFKLLKYCHVHMNIHVYTYLPIRSPINNF